MDVKQFGTDEQHKVVCADADQYLIASTVKRLIIVSVDLKLLGSVIE
jgi:hypothetical protein